MTVSFVTPGIIDLEHIFTFGMSAKESDNPIGFFGTGLKFAVATLLRTGHTIMMWVGDAKHEFSTEQLNFRGKEFHKVFLDSTPLNFTTELGKTWEVWMAFRELHSNTLDEKGKTVGREASPTIMCEAHGPQTIIVVEGHGIDQAFSDMPLIFCDSPVLASNAKIEVRAGKSPFLFYHGVRIGKLAVPSLYTYNILSKCDLTEDRTLKFQAYDQLKMAQDLCELSSVEILQRIVTAPLGTFEHNMDFDGATPSESFIEVIKSCYRDSFLNDSARKLARTLNLFAEMEVPLDNIQRQQLDRAMYFLHQLGFDIDRYPVKVQKLHGSMGMAKAGVIYIDPVSFRMGTKQLAGTLFEEWFHLTEGCHDETRDMQNKLIDQIMSMGEKVLGEPV